MKPNGTKFPKKDNFIESGSYAVAMGFTTPRTEIPDSIQNIVNRSINLPIRSERYKTIETQETYYDNLNTNTTTDKICIFLTFNTFIYNNN